MIFVIQVCCPLDGINPPVLEKPKSEDLSKGANFNLILILFQSYYESGGCIAQNGENSTCVQYNRCSPFLQLLSNIKQPFPEEIPELMKGSLLCDLHMSVGRNIPFICCPTKAVDFEVPETPEDTPDAERLSMLLH